MTAPRKWLSPALTLGFCKDLQLQDQGQYDPTELEAHKVRSARGIYDIVSFFESPTRHIIQGGPVCFC